METDKARYHKVIMTDADVDGDNPIPAADILLPAMRPLIEAGFLYIAQPPLFRAKRGQSEVYLKDQRELDTYLMEAGLKDVMLTQDEGAQIAGADLQDAVVKATAASRLIEILGRRVGHRDVVEQAAIAGLNGGTLDSADAADYLGRRRRIRRMRLKKGGRQQ